MKRIAITGGIGSGKSTVSSILKGLGFAVLSCDEIYKEIICSDEYIKRVGEIFPEAVKNQAIDKAILAKIIFFNSENRKKIEEIAHPLIMDELLKRMEEARRDLVFAEVPLLFEGGYDTLFDGIVVVNRDKNLRIQAVKDRDRLGIEAIEARMNAQFDYDSSDNQTKLVAKGVKVIINNTTKDDLEGQVLSVLREFI